MDQGDIWKQTSTQHDAARGVKIANMTQLWKWTFQNSAGEVVNPAAVTAETFDSQAEAEAWLGEEYPSLVDHGVDDVVLFEGDTKIYGPMSLHPAN